MDRPMDTITVRTYEAWLTNLALPAGICAFVTGLYGIAKRSPQYALMSMAAGVNSGVTACSFFALREIVISPLLVNTLPWPQYSRRRRDLGISHPDDLPAEPPTWSDVRKHNTLDSGLSGAIAGGALRGWKSGPRAILPGMLTIGAVCTLLQLVYNEASVSRLRYISGLKVKAPANEAPATPAIRTKTASERFLTLIGIHQVTEEEYLEKMKATRDSHLRRIAELEQQLAAEKAQEESKDP
ncbi:hypothetical protein C0995_015275 [Termitomyces sp. Mi166|nr:hypothetical protein C0995_015275 [Termitomyces sp. Mi166\